jgi:hypothetical protein
MREKAEEGRSGCKKEENYGNEEEGKWKNERGLRD